MPTSGRFEPELREAFQVYSARVRATIRGSDRYDQQGGWVETLLPLGLLRCTICSHVSVGVGGLVGWIYHFSYESPVLTALRPGTPSADRCLKDTGDDD